MVKLALYKKRLRKDMRFRTIVRKKIEEIYTYLSSFRIDM